MINGSGEAEITATNGGGDVDSEVQVLHGNGRAEAIPNEGNDILGGVEMGQESSKENTQVQAPKSRIGEMTDTEKAFALTASVEESNKNGLAAYNGFVLKTQYPRAYNKLVEYMGNKAQIPGMMDDDTVLGILLYSPRIVVFEFFDINEIFVNTKIGIDRKWSYEIDTKHQIYGSKLYTTRVLAEVEGFHKAFELLEQKLNT